MAGSVRVFIASSLDGFIAGPQDELDWLDAPEGTEDTFTPFFATVGAMLMGRRTFDVVAGFVADAWPYGDTPVLVATSRPLDAERASVHAATGTIHELMAEARHAAGERDVYIDGGTLIRSALVAGLVDEITVTIIPMILGRGVPLFAGLGMRCGLEGQGSRDLGNGLVELRYRVRR